MPVINFRPETRPGGNSKNLNLSSGLRQTGMGGPRAHQIHGRERGGSGGSPVRSLSPGPSYGFWLICHMHAVPLPRTKSPILSAQRRAISPLRSYTQKSLLFLWSAPKGLIDVIYSSVVPACSCHLPELQHLLRGRLQTFCLPNWTRECLGSVPSTCLRV